MEHRELTKNQVALTLIIRGQIYIYEPANFHKSHLYIQNYMTLTPETQLYGDIMRIVWVPFDISEY